MNLKQHLDRQAAITRLPSPEQAKAGNYLKGRVKAHGLPVVIENARGSMRRGVGPGGKAWAVKMPAHYGYISRTEGADGDHVDVYLGVHLNSPKIYVLDQNHADTGKFDEHKVFMGFASHRQVLATYRKAFTDGKADKRFGVLHEMTREQFHDWLQKGDTTKALHRASGGRVAMADGGDPEAEPSGRPRVYITGNPEEGLLPTYNDEPARNPSESRPLFPLFPQKSDPDNLPAPLVAGAGLANVYTGLTGTAGKERFQTWPEKMVRSGASLPHDVMSGDVPQWEADPVTGEMHTSTPMIERAQDTAGMAGGTSFGALDTSAATLGAGPVRRAPSVEPTITNRGNGAYDVHVDGQFAGVANVASDGNKPFLSSISLEPQFQRQGIGSQVYQAIESDIGRPLVPSPLGLTDSATAFWKNRLSGVPDNQRAAMIEEAKKIGRGYGVKEDSLTNRFAPLLLSDSGKPGAAIAGARRALPMDEASRMARATEQGYTVDAFKGGQPHDWATMPETNGRGEVIPGTENRIPKELTTINAPDRPYAGFFSDNPEVANRFAAPFEYGGVWPTKLKFDNPLVIDATGHHAADFQFSSLARERGTTDQMQAFHDAFTKGDHDGVILKNTKDEGTVYIPKNPEQIRSRFAAFDPRNVGRSGLLLSDSGKPGAAIAGARRTLPMDEASRMARATEQGFDGPWYHGSERTDRLTENGKIDPRRATSGPMPFFTDNPEVASNYARGKPDTSLMASDTGHTRDYFTVSAKDLGFSGRRDVPVEQTWNYLPPEKRAEILDKARRVGHADPDMGDGPMTLHPEGVDGVRAGGSFEWSLRENRGNALAALRDIWVDSGRFFDNPSELSEVYRLAGYPLNVSEKNAPWTQAQGVLPARIRMTNPLHTENKDLMVNDVLPKLEQMFARDRTRQRELSATDQWDKNTRYTPKDWIAQAKHDYEHGENSFVWTSIPDKITNALRSMGYDGMIDTGGKMGGDPGGVALGHRVAIPFGADQVRSQFAKFDPKNVGKSGLLLSDSAAPGAPLAALEKGSRFYSGLSRAVDAVQQPRMTGEQWLGTLSNKPGVKPEELQYTGLSDFLNARRGQPVTKDEIAQHLDSNAVKLEEVMKGDKRTSTTGETIFQARDRVAMDAYNEPYDSLTNYQRAAVDDEMRARTPTKYHDYQLPGGENYREFLMTLPEKDPAGYQFVTSPVNGKTRVLDAEGRDMGVWNDRASAVSAFQRVSDNYKSSHWDEPNILAHVRMNDRTMLDPGGFVLRNKTSGNTTKAFPSEDAALAHLQTLPESLRPNLEVATSNKPIPKKSLHLEEIQSDWHQQGRDKGYDTSRIKGEASEQSPGFWRVTWPDGTFSGGLNEESARQLAAQGRKGGVPDAPFKKTWHELALKRALHEAAEKGYDRLSWTPGEAQAARYDLSKQIESLKATPVMDQHGLKYEIRAKGKGGTTEPINTVATEAELPNIVGKEMAQKIVEQTEGKKPVNFSGLDLKVGGEGMKGFYDQIIPKAVEKIGKEYGLKAQKGSLGKPAPEGPFEVRNAGTNAHGEDIFNVYDGTGKMIASDFKSKNAAEDAAITLSYTKPRKSEPVWYVDLPPETRQRMLHKGFSLFEDSAFTGAPMSALEHLNDPAHKIRAIRKRGQGIATGKSAKGWEFKRPDPVKGTWDRHVAEVKHGWESDKRGALNEFGDAINPNMKPEDWDFMTSGNFRARGGRTGFASGGAPAFDPDKPFDAAPDFDPDKPFDAAPATPTGEDKGAWNAAGRGAYQGATFNFGDELRGLGEAGGVKPDEWNDPISTVKGAYKYWTGDKGAEQSYDAAVTRERQADKLAAEQHPIAYHGAEIAGSIPSSLMLPGGSVARGATLANRARQGATLGVVAGGLSGAGDGEDAGSRLTGAGIGAVTGGAGGALAAPATDLAGYALKRTLGPAWNAIVTTARGSEREAARRVYTTLQADEVDIAAGKMNGMTIQQWQAAKAAGEPVTLADLGGARTQSLLRSSANTSPEARGTLEKAIGDRFDDQSTRVARDVRSLVNGGANAHKTADQLVAEYDVARAPAYKAAFLHPNASSLWDGDFEQMATAPAVQQAIKMASVNARDEAAKLGLKPPVNPFTFNRDGTVGLTDPNFKPNLQFWDVVKKNLDGGDRLSQQWAKILRNKLDTYDTGYNKARGIAADFFGEKDALQAGRTLPGKNVDPETVAAQMRRMNPQERDLFREGYASDWAGRVVERMADSRDVTKAMFNSPAERKMAAIIFGPQGLQTMQNRMTLETVMDGARKALGNSTTARQLIEAGLAGGAVGGYLEGDWKGAAAGALSGAGARKALGTEMAAGARKLIGKVDAKTAARVADLLTSNDPRKLAQGMRIMNANKKVADGMRAIADRMLNTTQAQAPRPRLNIDTTGWSGGVPARADQEQQQP